MQTEAVDCDPLSTPDFNIEDKGVYNRVTRVYVSNEQVGDYAPKVYLPRSISTRAQACCTVFVVYLKYACRIYIILKQVFTLDGGLSIGSIKFYLNISARIENTRI